MTLLARRSAICSLLLVAYWSAGCAAAVEKQAAKIVVKPLGALWESVAAKLTPVLRRGGMAAENAVGRQLASWTLKGERGAVFKAFESASPRVRWKVVRRDVRDFVRAFEKGAREPETYFEDPLADRSLVARWNATPKQDRVFVAGTQRDTAVVEALRARLEADGKTVFFYKFCARTAGEFCDSSTVGAFFGTAGTAVLAMTEVSGASRFVPHEIAAGVRVMAGRSELIILTPAEAMMNGAQTRVIQASVESGSDALVAP